MAGSITDVEGPGPGAGPDESPRVYGGGGGTLGDMDMGGMTGRCGMMCICAPRGR